MLIFRVRLPLDDIPFFSNFIALWLSWYTKLSENFITCASKKYCIHNIWGIRSSTPTSSASVELVVFRLFLFEAEYRASHPIVIILPGRIFMSWCTANAVSTQYFTVPVPLDSKVSTKSLVLLRYSSMREFFFPRLRRALSLASWGNPPRSGFPDALAWIVRTNFLGWCGTPGHPSHLICARSHWPQRNGFLSLWLLCLNTCLAGRPGFF